MENSFFPFFFFIEEEVFSMVAFILEEQTGVTDSNHRS